MNYINNLPNINETFIIEPVIDTGQTFIITACTAVFTNSVISCSGDSYINLGTSEIDINNSLYPVIDASIDLGSQIERFRHINTVSGNSSYWNSTLANISQLSIGNSIVSYSGITNLSGLFLSGSTNGFVLVPISNIVTSDTFLTGGTFNYTAHTLTLNQNNNGPTVNISGITDVYTTGSSFANNVITFTNNSGGTFTTYLDIFSGLTVNGILSAATISATTYYGNGQFLTGIATTNTYTTASTYNAATGVLTNIRNDNSFYTAGTWNYLSAATINGNTLGLVSNGGGISNLTINAVTGGTYNNGIITLSGSGTLTSISGLPTTFSSVYTTGFTYNNNIFTLTNNTGGTLSATINTVTGLTVNGILSAATISATTYYGNGQFLTGIATTNTFTTASTYNAATGILSDIRNDGITYTAGTWNYLSAATINGNTISLISNGSIISANTINAATGGTYNNGIITLKGTGTLSTITGLPLITPYTTAFTYTNNIFSLTNNTGGTLSATINTVTGLTVNGILTAATISATTYYGNGQFLTGITTTNTYTTASTYNAATGILTHTRNDGSLYTAGTWNYLSAATINGNTINLSSNGGILTANTINAVTGGTYNGVSGTITLLGSGTLSNITGLPTVVGGGIYTTGFTYSSNTFTLTNNTGGTLSTTINIVTGLTVNGILSAATISATTYYGNGQFLTGIVGGSSADTFTTASTYNAATGVLSNTRNDNSVYTAGTWNYLSAATINGNTISLISNGKSITASTINAVTGGTFTGNTIIFSGSGSYTTSITGVQQTLKYYSEYSGTPAVSPLATGLRSIALGDGAQAASTDMFTVGYQAGSQATNASGSTFIGFNAGNGATNATTSNFIGFNAGSGATFANNSTFIGNGAGSGATSANTANFFGNSAGYQATSANNSNFMGLFAGYQATNANNSTFIGQLAGYQATNANNSIFIGLNAGLNATNASDSFFAGNMAGHAASSANGSNFIGHMAGYNATNAQFANFLGYFAGQYASSSSNSNIFGQLAASNAANSSNSNLFGYRSGYQVNITGSNFLGYDSGFQATNASYSNFIGYQAGSQATNANGSNFIGRFAGYLATGASYSNFIGYQVGSASTLASNNIIIGTNISLPSGSTNSFNIGGVLFGNGAYGIITGLPTMTAQTSGQLGINIVNTAITNALHVVATANPVRFIGLTGSTGDTNYLTVDATGVIHQKLLTGQIILGAAGSWPSLTSGSSYPTIIQTTTNRINYYSVGFAPSAQTYSEWGLALPSDFATGGTITANFLWLSNSPSTGTSGTTVWGLQGIAYSNGIAIDTAYGAAAEVIQANQGSNVVNVTTASTAVTLAGNPSPTTHAQFRVYRKGSASDVLSATTQLLEVKLNYTRT